MAGANKLLLVDCDAFHIVQVVEAVILLVLVVIVLYLFEKISRFRRSFRTQRKIASKINFIENPFHGVRVGLGLFTKDVLAHIIMYFIKNVFDTYNLYIS